MLSDETLCYDEGSRQNAIPVLDCLASVWRILRNAFRLAFYN